MTTRTLILFMFLLTGEPDLASGSDVNGSTESFEMVIEEATVDSATKQTSGKVLKIFCNIFMLFSDISFFC